MFGSPLRKNAEISQHESCIDLLVNILWFQNSSSCFEATHGFEYIHIYLSSTTLRHRILQYSNMQRSMISSVFGCPLRKNAEISQHESCIDVLVNILWFQNSSSCFEATHGFEYIHIYLSSTTLRHRILQYSNMQRSMISSVFGCPLRKNAEISQHESCIDVLVNILWFQNSSSCFEATHGFEYIHIYLSSTTLRHRILQYSNMQRSMISSVFGCPLRKNAEISQHESFIDVLVNILWFQNSSSCFEATHGFEYIHIYLSSTTLRHRILQYSNMQRSMISSVFGCPLRKNAEISQHESCIDVLVNILWFQNSSSCFEATHGFEYIHIYLSSTTLRHRILQYSNMQRSMISSVFGCPLRKNAEIS